MNCKINASRYAASLRLLVRLAAGLLIAFAPLRASAKEFSKVVVFGDSLSDNGQLFALSGGAFPPFPYFQGRFSNGPVWIENLAARLGVPLEDHAFGGAFTDASNINSSFVPGAPGMQTSVAAYLATQPRLDPKALYVIWGGANDYLNGFQTNPNIPVSNIVAEVLALDARGAKSFLIPNLPDLGSLPVTLSSPFGPLFNQLTAFHNAILAGAVQSLRSTQHGDKIYFMDANALVRNIRANPSAFGFTNVNDAAISVFPFSAEGYLFWDAVHPTAAGHVELSNLAFNIVGREEKHGQEDDDNDD